VAARKAALTAQAARERVATLEQELEAARAAVEAEPDKDAAATLKRIVDALGFDDARELEEATDRIAHALDLDGRLGEYEPEEVAAVWALDEDLIEFAQALGPLNKIADRLRELGIGVGEREPAELAGLIVRMLG
jgi:hypothetical protein